MEEKELRRILKVLLNEVQVLKEQSDNNTVRLTALEAAVRSTLEQAPQAFEASLAAMRGHGQTLPLQSKRASEIEAILHVLSQPAE